MTWTDFPTGIAVEQLSSTGAANTKAAKEFIAAAREAGQVPMKAADDLPPRRMTAHDSRPRHTTLGEPA